MVAIVLLVLGGGLLVVALSSKDVPPPPPKPRVIPMGFGAEQLRDQTSPGAIVFIKTCAQCHGLPNPKMHTRDEWPQVTHAMLNRLMRRKILSMSNTKFYVPSESEAALIGPYLAKYARDSQP